jgi:hypothetical protein
MTTETQTKPRPPAKPKPKLIPPRAYALDDTGLPFARATWFRWEAKGVIPPLLRLGGKTLVPAQTIDDIMSGKIVLPANAGRQNPPTPLDRGGHQKRRAKLKAEAEPSTVLAK